MDMIRRAIQNAKDQAGGPRAPIPASSLADTLEAMPFVPGSQPPQGATSVPPVVGQLGYYSMGKPAPAWRINSTGELCHFSAPKWVYPGPGPTHVGIVDSVGAKVEVAEQAGTIGRQVGHVDPIVGFSSPSTDERVANREPTHPRGTIGDPSPRADDGRFD